MEKFYNFLFLAAIFVTLAIGVRYGLEKAEIAECNTWVTQAATIPDWYATDWQVEQCDEYKIDLSAYERI